MTIKRIFKSTIAENTFLFKSGKAAVFNQGRFVTGNQAEIDELEAEIEAGIPFFFVDKDDYSIDTTLQDKINAAQREAAVRVLKEHGAKAGDEPDSNIPGNTPNPPSDSAGPQGPGKPFSSDDSIDSAVKPADQPPFDRPIDKPLDRPAFDKPAFDKPLNKPTDQQGSVENGGKPSTATMLANLKASQPVEVKPEVKPEVRPNVGVATTRNLP